MANRESDSECRWIARLVPDLNVCMILILFHLSQCDILIMGRVVLAEPFRIPTEQDTNLRDRVECAATCVVCHTMNNHLRSVECVCHCGW